MYPKCLNGPERDKKAAAKNLVTLVASANAMRMSLFVERLETFPS